MSDIETNRYGVGFAVHCADILGVTRQRVEQLAKADRTFPKPVFKAGRTTMYSLKEVKEWGKDNGYVKRY